VRRLLVQMVTRNEADRYLDSSLAWHFDIFDGIHVYDDRSDDDTVQLAEQTGCEVTQRPLNEPSFLEHEGNFRQAGWHAFEDVFGPTLDDWILALDADEFLLARADEQDRLWQVIDEAERLAAGAVFVPIPEVFEVETDDSDGCLQMSRPKVRVDGYWGQIVGTRLFRYQPGGLFANRRLASGSEPTYVSHARKFRTTDLWLMHYGYADPRDKLAKYERYSGMSHFHNDAHIRSIMEEPVLVPWDGPAIDIWRGRRPVTRKGGH
jgi:glycosyltransferase involved in cell wall biosynthesis